jgi:hypothetical protein
MATRSQLEADLQHFKDKNPDWVMYKRDRELVQTYYNLLSYKPFSTGAGSIIVLLLSTTDFKRVFTF